jgi:alkylhydroperoxidase family enzyme
MGEYQPSKRGENMADTLLPRLAREEMSEDAAAARDALYELSGDATFVEVFARAPELLNFAMVDFYQKLFFEGRVAEKYKQLARLRLSMSHGCRTCNSQNVPSVSAFGYSDEQIAAMWVQDYSGFPEDEQVAMELADEIALDNRSGELTPELYERLQRHFSIEDILELSMCMGVIVGLVKLSFTLGLVDKEEYCEFGADRAA